MKYIRLSGYILVALAAAAIVYLIMRPRSLAEISVSHPARIMVTPQIITGINEIGQWEFLTITDEEVVEARGKRSLAGRSRIVLIYHGTLRLGIDLSAQPDGWIENHNDTLIVRMPEPVLLDDRFIDEAATEVFYQRGSIGADTRAGMYDEAARRMRRRALTPQNIERVRAAARARLESLFLSLGAKAVIFEPGQQNQQSTTQP